MHLAGLHFQMKFVAVLLKYEFNMNQRQYCYSCCFDKMGTYCKMYRMNVHTPPNDIGHYIAIQAAETHFLIEHFCRYLTYCRNFLCCFNSVYIFHTLIKIAPHVCTYCTTNIYRPEHEVVWTVN